MAYNQMPNYEIDKEFLKDEGLLRMFYKRCFGNAPSYEDSFVNIYSGINNLGDNDKLQVSLGCAEFSDGSKRVSTQYSCKEKYFGSITDSTLDFSDYKIMLQITNLNGRMFKYYCYDPTVYEYSKRGKEEVIELPEELILQGSEYYLLSKHILNEGIGEFAKHPRESFLRHVRTIKNEQNVLNVENDVKSM